MTTKTGRFIFNRAQINCEPIRIKPINLLAVRTSSGSESPLQGGPLEDGERAFFDSNRLVIGSPGRKGLGVNPWKSMREQRYGFSQS